MEEVKPEPIGVKIGLAIVSGYCYENFTTHLVQALSELGISDVIVTDTSDPWMLGFACQKLLKLGRDGVIAAGIVAPGNESQVQAITASLVQTGLMAGSPVVPALLCHPTMIENKGIIPAMARTWANNLASALGCCRAGDEEVKVPKPAAVRTNPVVAADVLHVDELMAAFKASLDVSTSYIHTLIYTITHHLPSICHVM